MQMANTQVGDPLLRRNVRQAQREAAGAVQRLLRMGVYIHIHVDWSLPGDWLGTPDFVVYERHESRLQRRALAGCLAVGADPLPAAWVRVAAVDSAAAFAQCAAMFGVVLESLDPRVDEIAWFITDNWPQHWLERLDFTPVGNVMSFIKDDLETAPFAAPGDLTIRSLRPEDLPALEAMEAAAFEPRWRHSARGLEMAWRQAISFDVALLAGEPVAFQFSTGGGGGAHLARMTVRPDYQGQGIGAALLAHALEGYRKRKLRGVTLNTQEDNVASQRLYTRFGFRPTGFSYPVWSYYPGREAHSRTVSGV